MHLRWLARLLLPVLRRYAAGRAPSVVIGGAASPYLLRWHLLPRNPLCNLYLHRFLRSDDDRALHDHPWVSASLILSGGYIEHRPTGPRWLLPGDLVVRGARSAHRVALRRDADSCPVWTLFLTGPRVREWGFHCPGGWRHWRAFTAGPDGTTIGRGCD